MSTAQAVDLLISARWVLPIAPAQRVLADHAVAVSEGRILALGSTAELERRYVPRERIERLEHVLLPGLVNAHTRIGLTLLRARAAERPAWPLAVADAERPARLLTADQVSAGARLAIAEMLRAGITSFASEDAYPQEIARIAAALRMRAAIGLPVSERSGGWAQGATAHLAQAARLWDEYRADPSVRLYFAPESLEGLEDATLERVRTVADELDARVAMPVHRSESAIAASRARDGRRPLERLQGLGLLRPGFTALHMNRLSDADLQLIARTGIAVVACPQANLRRGFGGCPLPALLEAAVPVGLGTGSPTAVLALDMLAEARAALWQLAAGPAVAALPRAASALRLATLGSAQALGLAAEVGSIEAGKAADLIAIDLRTLACSPEPDPIEATLLGVTRERVSDVWIGGRAALAQGRLLAFDEEELLASVRDRAAPRPAISGVGA